MAETKTWEKYREALSWQGSMGFTVSFPEYIRFREGDQWAPPTKRTRNLPRPVFNIIKMFIRTKRAMLLSQPLSINYSPSEYSADAVQSQFASDAARDMTDYAAMLWRKTRQDELNYQFIDDAAVLGTGILHYYFDDTAGTQGEIRGETIDPINFFVGNPQEQDVQAQPWIIISQRVPVEDVKALAKREGLSAQEIELIGSDAEQSAEGYDSARREMHGEDKCTVLTRYFRKDGAVHFDRCTRSVEIVKSRSLTPDGRESVIRLYPVVILTWEVRKKCIFGIGETETLIPAQKAVNFLKAMELLSVQQCAFPKILTKPNALRQTLTNEPGEVVTDYTPNGIGITYMSAAPLSGAAGNLAASIFDLLRVVTGVTEVASGEAIGAQMAASAIIALQQQARTPIEETQRRFIRRIEEVGKIWEELIKAYYYTERNIVSADAKDDENVSRPFKGTAYAHMQFDLAVDAGASSDYGEVLAQTTLDNMLARGDIDIRMYVKLAPRNVVPFREELLRMLDERDEQQKQMAAMQMQTVPQQANEPIGLHEAAYSQPHGVGGIKLPEIPNMAGVPKPTM